MSRIADATSFLTCIQVRVKGVGLRVYGLDALLDVAHRRRHQLPDMHPVSRFGF